MKAAWEKLNNHKPYFKKLSSEHFKEITEKINITRDQLNMTQQQMKHQYSDALATKEKTLLLKLEQWSIIEESIIRQKARVNWIKLGDANTKYFSASSKRESNKNK